MAFGDSRGDGGAAQNSITNPTNITMSWALSLKDLVFVVVAEQTSLTAGTVTDNLGNTYNAVNAGTDSGTVTGKAYYAVVTNAGTLTQVSVAATASADNVAVRIAAWEGPFEASPLDAAPANIEDVSSQFDCPASGTLAQANELLVGWMVASSNAVLTVVSPGITDGQTSSQAVATATFAHKVVSSTASDNISFTGTNPTDAVQGTASFKQEVVTRPANKTDWSLVDAPAYANDLRTWAFTNTFRIPPPEPVPFNQYHWPLTPAAPYAVNLRSWLVGPSTPILNLKWLPSRVIDWGMWEDTRKPRTWTRAPQLAETVVAKPPLVFDWQLPRASAYPVSLRTWTVAPQITIQAAVDLPVRNAWTLPLRDDRRALTWAPFATIARDAARYVPSRVSEWGTPDRVPFQPAGIQQNAILLSVVPPAKPISVGDWQLPARPVYPVSLRTWTNQGIRLEYVFRAPYYARRWERPPFSYQVFQPNVALLTAPPAEKPINQSHWPLPIRHVRQALTWVQTPMFAAPVDATTYIPSRVVDWGEVPAARTGVVLTWIQSPFFAAAAVAAKPVNQQDWPLPLRASVPVQTWTQSPTPKIATGLKPVNQFDWPLPLRRVRDALTWVQSPTFAAAVVAAKPVNQSDWPLPIRRVRDALTWVQSPMFAAAVVAAKPVNQQDWPLPLRAPERARTWIQTPNFAAPVSAEFIPFRVVDWGKTWAQPQPNTWLTQSNIALFTTSPPALPRNQYDWPLPIRNSQGSVEWLLQNSSLLGFPVLAIIVDMRVVVTGAEATVNISGAEAEVTLFGVI